jgi:DMSO/TMAO reductase YedYZ molybdopterin-dependent catalytic subunit
MGTRITRRSLLGLGAAGLAARVTSPVLCAHDDGEPTSALSRPFLTPGKDFGNVSRGDPLPYTLKGDALAKAGLTPQTWKLEIIAEDNAEITRPLRQADGTALDFKALLQIGRQHGVRFLKAMQCTNIAVPLGQGLWEGVPLRDVLRLCGRLVNPRRLYYWGYHNDDPKQMFRSSLAMNQVLDTPPGELPPFIAYRLNGGPIPLERGGPVRMVVPWAHGFKSVKWLQHIVLTNHYENNDTYALQGNDPESFLKTAAYFQDLKPESLVAAQPLTLRGTAMVGWPGLEGVQYWLRPDTGTQGKLADDDPAWNTAGWKPATIDSLPPNWAGELPAGVAPKDVWGFGLDGKPKEWPMRYCVAHWTLKIKSIPPGKYELRVRTVDKNGFAQPEPRPISRSGKNAIQCKLLEVK